METSYIQFEAPKNIKTAEVKGFINRSVKSLTKGLLKMIFPIANPDFENKIDNVKYWLIECEIESGIPLREIGLDEQQQVILKMPFKNNYGYWADNNLLLNGFKEHFNALEITKENFEQQWNLLEY